MKREEIEYEVENLIAFTHNLVSRVMNLDGADVANLRLFYTATIERIGMALALQAREDADKQKPVVSGPPAAAARVAQDLSWLAQETTGEVREEPSSAPAVVETVPRVRLAEFIKVGYLQEVNRQFFHPLGLSLAIDGGTNDVIFRAHVSDHRESEIGPTFGEGELATPLAATRAARIQSEHSKRSATRLKKLGFSIQPVVSERPTEPLRFGWEKAK
jgi:hypothetical protein